MDYFYSGTRVSIGPNTLLKEFVGQTGVVLSYEGYDCYWVKLDSGIEIMPYGRCLRRV